MTPYDEKIVDAKNDDTVMKSDNKHMHMATAYGVQEQHPGSPDSKSVNNTESMDNFNVEKGQKPRSKQKKGNAFQGKNPGFQPELSENEKQASYL